MTGILLLESLTRGNTLKQGDKTPLTYKLLDADGDKLSIAGKPATVRLVYPNYLTIGYEKSGLIVSQNDTVTFTIDKIIPSQKYHVEIIVDNKFVFPSRSAESKFTIDKSSLGNDARIIEIVGVDAVVRKAVDLINDDPALIIDEDKLVGDIISNTGIGSIEDYYQAFDDLKPRAELSISRSVEALTNSRNALSVANGIDAKATNALSLSQSADALSKSVQEQFNQVVINGDSSVEAAQARVDASGHTNPTLKERLDKEYNEVTAQLAQTTMDVITGVVKPNVGEQITTNGFYEFGNTYRYNVFPLSGAESFIDSGKGFFITLQGEIKISDTAKITPVPSDRVSVGALGCNNINDDKCFQSAFNLAKLRDCNVEVDVNVNIERFIDVYRGGSYEERRIIEISGRGVMSKNNSGYMFTNTLSRSGGNIKFNGIHFRSVEGAGTHIYHGGFLLRMYFENCHFIDVDHLTKARETEPWDYMQTVYFSGGTVVGGKGWFIDTHTAYDVSFTHSLVEQRESFAKIDLNHSVRITDNVIEGLSGKVLEVKHGRSLIFDDNYMEYNGTSIVGPSITIDNPSFSYGFNEMLNFSFKNNLYIATDTQVNNQNFYLMSIKNWGKSISVANNFCDCNFLMVENRSTVALMPASLMDIYSNNVINAKKVLNGVNSPTFVSMGSGSLLREFFDRPLYISQFSSFNPEQNNITTQDNSLVIMSSAVGSSTNKIGFKIENILLARNTTYAIGLSGLCNDANKESDGVQVILTNKDTGSVVYKDVIDITDASVHRGRVPFYNLNPFNNNTAQHVDIEVSMVPKSGSFSDSVLQRLSVANLVLQRGTIATDAIY